MVVSFRLKNHPHSVCPLHRWLTLGCRTVAQRLSPDCVVSGVCLVTDGVFTLNIGDSEDGEILESINSV